MSTPSKACPVCEQGRLTADTCVGEVQHNDAKLVVHGLECYRCDKCAATPVLADQIKRNQVRIADARRGADGLLRAHEIRATREAMGVSQAQAAEIFGGGANAFSKYERGEVTQSIAMDRLMRLARDLPGVAHLLASYAGVSIDPAATLPSSTKYVAASALRAAIRCTAPSADLKIISNIKYGEAA